jgi:hypothetical protein
MRIKSKLSYLKVFANARIPIGSLDFISGLISEQI